MTLVAAAGCHASGPSAGDPLGCDLPEPCDVVHLMQGSLELDPQDAAACIYDTIVKGDPAHVREVFTDTREVTWDLYIRGTEPAVITTLDCEIDGPCQDLKAERCVLQQPMYLDCSMGSGPARVCASATEWCQARSTIEPTCP